MGFAAGFSVGSNAVSEGLRDRILMNEQASKDAQAARLRGIMDTAATEFTETARVAPSAGVRSRYDAENEALAKQDTETFGGGLTVNPSDYQYGEPTVAQNKTMFRHGNSVADTADGARYKAMGDEYAANGEPVKAAVLYGLDKKNRMDKFDLDEKTRGAEDDANNRLFTDEVSSLGGNPGAAKIKELGAKYKITPDKVSATMKTVTGMNDAQIKEVATAKKREMLDSYMNGGDDGFLGIIDPNPADGVKPTLQRAKDGKVRLMYGDKPILGDQTFNNTLDIIGFVASTIDGDPVSYVAEKQKQDFERQKLGAQIGEIEAGRIHHLAGANSANASAENSRASAAQTGLENTNLRTGKGKDGNTSKDKLDHNAVKGAFTTTATDKYGTRTTVVDENGMNEFYNSRAAHENADTQKALYEFNKAKAARAAGKAQVPPPVKHRKALSDY